MDGQDNKYGVVVVDNATMVCIYNKKREREKEKEPAKV